MHACTGLHPQVIYQSYRFGFVSQLKRGEMLGMQCRCIYVCAYASKTCIILLMVVAYCTFGLLAAALAAGGVGAGPCRVFAAADDLYPQNLVGEGLVVEGELEPGGHLRFLRSRRRVASGHVSAYHQSTTRGGAGDCKP